MDIKEALKQYPFILSEGAVIERIRRSYPHLIDEYLANSLMVYSSEGEKILKEIYKEYIDIAYRTGFPVVILTPTWRASKERIGRSGQWGRNVNHDNFKFLDELRKEYGSFSDKIIIGGLCGCANDAYKPEEALSRNEAIAYHEYQITALASSGVDFLIASTLPALCEASGIAALMERYEVPYIISFIIRNDGSVLDGTPLSDAITMLDKTTRINPVIYMVNCVHPSILKSVLENETERPSVLEERLRGIQANTSPKSPEELDGLKELDTEKPEVFATSMVELHHRFNLKIIGGCCGTDNTHIEAIASKVQNSKGVYPN